jgi:hypothetical protein
VPWRLIERNREDLAQFVSDTFKWLGMIGRFEPSAVACFYAALMIDA